jgi:DNA-binding transcriptional MerR regulator
MHTLKTREAAAELNVSPNTLRTWERRFQFPNAQRSAGGHRLYYRSEIVAMRDALRDGLSISSAISVAREEFGVDVTTLAHALLSFSRERADRTIEASLVLRSIERSVEELMLPALDAVRRGKGPESAAWAFATSWACGWLRRAMRFASADGGNGAVIVGNACDGELDPATPAMLALELFCTRAGATVMSLPVASAGGLADAVAAIGPDALVVAGGHAPDDVVANWAYAVRACAGARPIMLFRREVARQSPCARARALPASPSDAQRQVLAQVHVGRLPAALAS